MKKHPAVSALLAVLSLLFAVALPSSGCGNGDPQKCISDCVVEYNCPPGEPNPNCEADLLDCKADCGAPESRNAPTGEAASALTPTLSARWTITSQNAPGTATVCNDPAVNQWCECGTDYTDSAVSCVQPGATMIFEYPAPGAPVAAGARFQVNTTLSTYQNPNPGTVKLHVLTRPVVRPVMGQAGYCPGSSGTSTNVASWYRYGAGAWEVPGAKGAADRSASSAPRVDAAGTVLSDTVAPHDATTTERWDVTALLNACPASGSCFLALYLETGVHMNAFGGTASLTYELAGPPPVCGNGAKEGVEACDDANTVTGDGCSGICTVESGWACAGSPSSCATTCGDGVMAGAEECDLGGGNGAAATCSSTCETQVCTCQ